MLRVALSRHIDHGAVPDLAALTEIARQVATDEIVRLAQRLIESASADVAVFSAVAIHGPDADYIAVRDAWANVGSAGEPISLL